MTEPPDRPERREPHPPPPGDTPFGVGPWPVRPYGTPTGRDVMNGRPVYSGRLRRLLAAVIDLLALYAIIFVVTMPIAGIGTMYERASWRQLVADIIATALAFLYYVLQHGRWGRTLGKRAMSLMVVREADGGPVTYLQAAWRLAFQYVISALTCGIGGLVDVAWILWDDRRQALHDKVAKTVVLETRPGMRDPYEGR